MWFFLSVVAAISVPSLKNETHSESWLNGNTRYPFLIKPQWSDQLLDSFYPSVNSISLNSRKGQFSFLLQNCSWKGLWVWVHLAILAAVLFSSFPFGYHLKAKGKNLIFLKAGSSLVNILKYILLICVSIEFLLSLLPVFSASCNYGMLQHLFFFRYYKQQKHQHDNKFEKTPFFVDQQCFIIQESVLCHKKLCVLKYFCISLQYMQFVYILQCVYTVYTTVYVFIYSAEDWPAECFLN